MHQCNPANQNPSSGPRDDSYYLVIEKQILWDMAQRIRASVEEISKHPSATHLIPIRDALTKISHEVFHLEVIAK